MTFTKPQMFSKPMVKAIVLIVIGELLAFAYEGIKFYIDVNYGQTMKRVIRDKKAEPFEELELKRLCDFKQDCIDAANGK